MQTIGTAVAGFLSQTYAVWVALGSVLAMRKLLHYFQLESYQLPGYAKSVKRNFAKAQLPGTVLAIVCLMVGPPAFSALCALAVGAGFYWMARRTKAKKALVFTPRMKRLCAVLLALEIVMGLALSLITPKLCLLVPLCAPLMLALAAQCAAPMEKRINMGFYRDAQKRLEARPDLIRIGVTGSYGKTSTKFLLRTILSERYNVLATPSSFNTAMGVTRIIREQLRPEHEVFIAEMGARHVGDIRELVELVHPTMGLLTSVGPQHLDTFGNIETVAATKYELIDGLPQDGIAVFARDGAICEQLYEKCPLKGRHLAGEQIWAEHIAVGPEGSTFELVSRDGTRVPCQTCLLGEHAIANLMLCAQAALCLGMTVQEIAAGIARCQSVEHRLQLLPTGNGVTVIDDAFNSNPVGAAAALRVMKNFPGRRIIITPGMVELGEKEAEYNRAFGEQMAESVDIAILVGGKHTAPIWEGLKAKGFARENCFIVASLDESTRVLGSLVRAGDVVLYENDLPDNYEEK